MYHHFINHNGRTVDQRTRHLPVNAEALVRSQISPYDFCGGFYDMGLVGLVRLTAVQCSPVSVVPLSVQTYINLHVAVVRGTNR